MRLIRTLVAPRWRPGRAALAGLLATLAYSVAMEGDIYITGNRFNDVRFIEGLLIGRAKPSAPVRLLAWGLHLLNGALLAEIYAAVFKRFLPGPGWLRGSIFASVFITGAWS